jgi:hypothetical protein
VPVRTNDTCHDVVPEKVPSYLVPDIDLDSSRVLKPESSSRNFFNCVNRVLGFAL